MASYNSFKELNGKTLKPGDCVIFNIQDKIIEYKVQEDFLSDTSLDSNTIIFSKLGISDKNEYAKNLYHYSIKYGLDKDSWPEYKTNDFEAATRLVLDLFNRCEAMNPKSFPLFKGKAEKTKKFEDAGFSFTVEDIPKDYPYHPYVIDQALVEFSKGIEKKITSAKEAFKVCLSQDIGEWFTWSQTSQGHNYWYRLFCKPFFVPKNYIPTYFIETPNKTTPEITSVPKNVSKTPLKIPCNYEETILSIEKKKVYF